MLSRIIYGAAIAYGILGTIALLLVPASLFGWFNLQPDPMSGLYAYLFSLPWIIVLLPLEEIDTWLALAVAAIGMALNFWLLCKVASAVSR